VQTLLAGYAGDERGDIKELIEEEDDLEEIVEEGIKEEQTDFKLIEQENKGGSDGKEEAKEQRLEGEAIVSPQEQSPAHAKVIAENSVPNTLIQSYFPNNEKSGLVGAPENSYTADNLMNN